MKRLIFALLLAACCPMSAATADEPLYAFTESELRQIGVVGFDEWKYQQGYGNFLRLVDTPSFPPKDPDYKVWPSGQRLVTKWRWLPEVKRQFTENKQ